MKRITMKSLSAGPDGAMHPGKTYPVDDKTAKDLVDGKYAEYAGAPKLEQAVKPPEPRAAVKQPEPGAAVKADPPEKAVHVGGGWYDYQGQRYKKTDLPEGAI